MRQSIEPTYDRQKTGNRYTIETLVNGKPSGWEMMPDPFVHHRVTLGWWDVLRAALRGRRVTVTVVVSADPEVVEDVCELDADYLGVTDSTRRQAWQERLDRALAEGGER